MTAGASYRGQPLVAFLLVVGGWIAMRVMAWDAGVAGAIELPSASTSERGPVAAARAGRRVEPLPPTMARRPGPAPNAPAQSASLSFVRSDDRSPGAVRAIAVAGSPLVALRRIDPAAAPASPSNPVLATRPEAVIPLQASARQVLPDRRWSADAWLLARSGGGAALPGGLSGPSYGASQMGAVLRYRLAAASGHRPTLHLRGSAALNGSGEREVAAGFSARPIARLPLTLAAEARVNGQPGRTRLRPAAFVHTELPPVPLPLRARGEFYGQAGYVGGNFASAFADGQLRIDRRVVRVGQGELRAGGGLWGGAQKGASRLDLGPAATLGMPLGGTATARLAVDWRFRVAGNAAPASGPAVTLSAGF